MPILYTNSNHIPVMGNKDKTRDGDATAENRDHSQSNRDHSRDREAARDTALAKTIAEAVARETQSISEVFTRKWRRLMRNIRTYLGRVTQPPYQLPLKLLLHQMALK